MVASQAVRVWLAERGRRGERTLPLSELVNRRVTDGFARRKRVWVRSLDDIDPGPFDARDTVKEQEYADRFMLGRSFARNSLASQRPIIELRPRHRRSRQT